MNVKKSLKLDGTVLAKAPVDLMSVELGSEGVAIFLEHVCVNRFLLLFPQFWVLDVHLRRFILILI